MITYSVHAMGFAPDDSNTAYTVQAGANIGIYRTAPGGTNCFAAPVHLPQGARVQNLNLDFCDSNATLNVSGLLFVQPLPSGAHTAYAVTSNGAPGCGTRVTTDLSGNNIVIDNLNNSYFFRGCLPAADSSTVLRTMSVQYRLQVSPAPATATFADVPVGSPFHRFVEALVAAGITGGCGGGNYCPDAPITRGQMAVFLSGALGLHWPN